MLKWFRNITQVIELDYISTTWLDRHRCCSLVRWHLCWLCEGFHVNFWLIFFCVWSVVFCLLNFCVMILFILVSNLSKSDLYAVTFVRPWLAETNTPFRIMQSHTCCFEYALGDFIFCLNLRFKLKFKPDSKVWFCTSAQITYNLKTSFKWSFKMRVLDRLAGKMAPVCDKETQAKCQHLYFVFLLVCK